MTKNPMATHLHQDGEQKSDDYNIFRDSLLRYCGYANEVGESFRYMYPKFVTPSYVVAFGYCLADSVSAGYQVMAVTEDVGDERSSSSSKTLTRSKETRAAIAFFDTLLWQSLASVAIPGGVINTIVRATRYTVARTVLIRTYRPRPSVHLLDNQCCLQDHHLYLTSYPCILLLYSWCFYHELIIIFLLAVRRREQAP